MFLLFKKSLYNFFLALLINQINEIFTFKFGYIEIYFCLYVNQKNQKTMY